MFGENAQEPGHQVQLFDPGDIADIALNDRLDIVEVPALPAPPCGTGQRLGVAAGENGLHKVFADNRGS